MGTPHARYGVSPPTSTPPDVNSSPATDVPDSITIEEFFSNEKYGRTPVSQSRNPYTCGITGKTYTVNEVAKRADYLSRAIAQILHFDPNEGTEWDRVVGLYSLNTVCEAFLVAMLLTMRY